MAQLKTFPDTMDWASLPQYPRMPYNKAEKNIITVQIAEGSSEMQAQTEFLSMVISEFDGSLQRKNMEVAEQYYFNNGKINEAKRTVLGRDASTMHAVPVVSEVLANNKLNHNFLNKLTRQKIGYLLGKPFVLLSDKDKDEAAKSFIDICKDYFGKSFFKTVRNAARDSIVKGIGWIQVYYDEKGKLRFRRCPPESVIPLWKDIDHNELDAVIYRYSIEIYSGGKKEIEKHVDYYTLDGIYQYIENDYTVEGINSGLRRVGSRIAPPLAHFALRRVNAGDAEQEGISVPINWARIPFIPFKYEAHERSLLESIKSLIDAYDAIRSGTMNEIQDQPNAITVVSNYDGENKEEFVHNKNVLRTMFVTGDGDAKALITPLNVAELNEFAEKIKNDIYEAGFGVNTSNKDIRDTSGVALRYLYADLDTDCSDWGTELEWSIMAVLWFVQQDIALNTGIDYSEVQYSVSFKKDAIINESELIQAAFQSVGVISDRTIASHHPWVTDPETELAEMRDEKEEELQLEEEYGEEPTNPAASQRRSMGQG